MRGTCLFQASCIYIYTYNYRHQLNWWYMLSTQMWQLFLAGSTPRQEQENKKKCHDQNWRKHQRPEIVFFFFHGSDGAKVQWKQPENERVTRSKNPELPQINEISTNQLVLCCTLWLTHYNCHQNHQTIPWNTLVDSFSPSRQLLLSIEAQIGYVVWHLYAVVFFVDLSEVEHVSNTRPLYACVQLQVIIYSLTNCEEIWQHVSNWAMAAGTMGTYTERRDDLAAGGRLGTFSSWWLVCAMVKNQQRRRLNQQRSWDMLGCLNQLELFGAVDVFMLLIYSFHFFWTQCFSKHWSQHSMSLLDI